MNSIIDIALMAGLLASALLVLWQRRLLNAILLMGLFSLLSTALFVVLDAADVAFTEAAVGAGISTVLFLAALAHCGEEHGQSRKGPLPVSLLSIAIALLLGTGLVYGTLDMPLYGDPEAPIHRHVAPEYLQESEPETGVPNVVTVVLASYRGYDTLGEVTVIFTAGVAVLLLLGGLNRTGRRNRSNRT
ncbi:MAG: DUF4040 domain-containing protein [Pseudomonadota bacterium]|nr:DUF4040 domain-containing protein [Pseudomonadota bacterium]